MEVHHAGIVPVSLIRTGNLPRGLHAHPCGLVVVGERSRVHYAEKQDGAVFVPEIERFARHYARGNEEAQARDAADLLAMIVMNLDERCLIAQRKHFADVLVLLHQIP